MADGISPEDRRARSGSFGQAAGDYQRYRPDYPVEAVSYLVGGTPAGGRILDLDGRRGHGS